MAGTFSFINKLVAVVDDPAEAPAIIRQLVQAGIPPADVSLLRGEEGERLIDSTGSASWSARAVRLSQYLGTDQSADDIVYEAAVHAGRSLIAVHFSDRALKPAATRVLREAGAHFINFYGRLQTEEVTRWRGPELILPDFLPPPRAKRRGPSD